jgi:hypothetical protein
MTPFQTKNARENMNPFLDNEADCEWRLCPWPVKKKVEKRKRKKPDVSMTMTITLVVVVTVGCMRVETQIYALLPPRAAATTSNNASQLILMAATTDMPSWMLLACFFSQHDGMAHTTEMLITEYDIALCSAMFTGSGQ